MAGTLMHLVIADRLLTQLSIQNPALFYCGNLAPDAIMNREGYNRDMKRHTHFKDGIRLHELKEADNFQIYRARFLNFYQTYVKKEDPHYELFLGYVVHMLVDELYVLHFRDRYCNQLLSQGRPVDDPEFWPQFGKDVDRIDYALVQLYPFHYPMPETLLSENDYEIPGYITSKELEDSKNYIIQKLFRSAPDSEPLTIMNLQENLTFIEMCVIMIPQMLAAVFPPA